MSAPFIFSIGEYGVFLRITAREELILGPYLLTESFRSAEIFFENRSWLNNDPAKQALRGLFSRPAGLLRASPAYPGAMLQVLRKVRDEHYAELSPSILGTLQDYEPLFEMHAAIVGGSFDPVDLREFVRVPAGRRHHPPEDDPSPAVYARGSRI